MTAPPASTLPGPVTLPDCQQRQGCQAYNITLRLGDNQSAGAGLSDGQVNTGGSGGLTFQHQDGDSSQPLQLAFNSDDYVSTDVTPHQASRRAAAC